MEHEDALPIGTRLEEYEIGGVLGRGGFGITYRAVDVTLGKVVALKEYLPRDFATRTSAGSVESRSDADRELYEWGREKFEEEGRTLARFNHPQVNRVLRFLEANGTAYLVLEYIEGETLSRVLAREERLSQAVLERLLGDVLSGLEEVHGAGYVHRDLKPGNLMVRSDGGSVILDFGAARQEMGQRVRGARGTSSIVPYTPGYAPVEQEIGQWNRIGPWSDLYALGMVAYRCVSGLGEEQVPLSTERQYRRLRGEPDLRPATEVGAGQYDEGLLKVIDWAIEIQEEDRPQSITEWRTAVPKKKQEKRKFSRWTAVAGGLVVGMAIIAGLLFFPVNYISGGRTIWEAVRPYSEEETLAFRSEATQVEGRVRIAERRMSEFRSQIETDSRDLQSSIRQLKDDASRASTRRRREAMEAEIAELEHKAEDLHTQSELLRKLVVESKQIAALSGRLVLARSLLDGQEYQKAITEYRAVDAGYDTLVNALKPSEVLAAHYNKAMQARVAWEQTKRDKQYDGAIPLANKLNDLSSHGQDLLDKAHFLAAVGVYEKLAADYSHLTKALTEGSQHQEKAARSKADWEAYVNDHNLATGYTSEYAKLFAEAEHLWHSGDIVLAGERYELLYKDYDRLEDAARNSNTYSSRAKDAQRNWRQYAQRNDLSSALDMEYDKRYQSAQVSLQNGQLVDSAKEFAELADAYSQLLSLAKTMVSNAASVESRRRDWQALIATGWARKSTGGNADDRYDTAESQKRSGFYTQATSTYASAGEMYQSLIRRGQENRNRYEESRSNWKREISELESDIRKYEKQISRHNRDADKYRSAAHRECGGGGFMEALGEGLESVNCELGCNQQVWNGSFYESRTDPYCVSRCRTAQQTRMRRRRGAIEECEESREEAQRKYERAEEKKESVENNLSGARSALRRMRNAQPHFTPI